MKATKTPLDQHFTETDTVGPATDAQADLIKELEEQLVQKDETNKRVLADYHNLQRQNAAERQRLLATAGAHIISDLLPTIDHLLLMQKHFTDPSLKMIIDGLLKTLESHGLQALVTVGQKYDPDTMEVVDTEPGEANMVLQEVAPGYRLNGEVLRHAKVIVGQSKANPEK